MDMTSVFISYRREDSRHQAGRLHDRLVAHFGSEQVFKDVDSIPLGLDFRQVLTEQVAGCDVFLAVISDTWLSIAGKGWTRRLDDPGDFVRIEVEAALDRKIPVIPVLVGSSSVPQSEELAESLRRLAFRNGLPVRPDPDFHNDVDRLIRVNIVSVMPLFTNDLKSYVSKAKETGHFNERGMADKEVAKPPDGPGWVVELRGYTYHYDDLLFLVNSIVELLNTKARQQDAAAKDTPAKPASPAPAAPAQGE